MDVYNFFCQLAHHRIRVSPVFQYHPPFAPNDASANLYFLLCIADPDSIISNLNLITESAEDWRLGMEIGVVIEVTHLLLNWDAAYSGKQFQIIMVVVLNFYCINYGY